MAKLLITPLLDGIDWKQVKIVLVKDMKRYTAKYGDLDITADIATVEVQKEGWETKIEFTTYRNFIVTKSKIELLVTGNPYHLDAALAFYTKYKKWPTI